MRGVDADRAGVARQARIGAALGAVAVQHIGAAVARALGDVGHRLHVAPGEVAAHRDAGEAELQLRRQRRERRIGARPAGGRVGDDADLMAALGLSAGEIEHVAEQAADGGAHDVNDPERASRRGRHVRTIVRR